MSAVKHRNILWRLLRKNISPLQIGGYVLANIIGLTIVLTALQFYRDTTSGDNSEGDSFFRRDFMVISKKVTELGTVLGHSTDFSPAEIDDLKRQPWVERLGVFTPSRFFVAASIDFHGRGMSTQMFFESIPDEFFDKLPKEWGFDPSDPNAEIPIVVSKDYLALYNFGFAASQGMPQMSEQIVGKFPLRITMAGNSNYGRFPARVVGFSSRLNTIAVPDEFMQWANRTYGDHGSESDVSRIILEVNDPGNPAIKQYFLDHNIEVAGDKDNQGKTAYFLSIVSMLVVVVGIVICVLAFFILMLSIYLLLQKNREKLHDLMMLGYTPRQTARDYHLLVIGINSAIFLVAVVAMLCLRGLWRTPFESLGLTCVNPWLTIGAGFIIMALITFGNVMAIRHTVNRNFRS